MKKTLIKLLSYRLQKNLCVPCSHFDQVKPCQLNQVVVHHVLTVTGQLEPGNQTELRKNTDGYSSSMVKHMAYGTKQYKLPCCFLNVLLIGEKASYFRVANFPQAKRTKDCIQFTEVNQNYTTGLTNNSTVLHKSIAMYVNISTKFASKLKPIRPLPQHKPFHSPMKQYSVLTIDATSAIFRQTNIDQRTPTPPKNQVGKETGQNEL